MAIEYDPTTRKNKFTGVDKIKLWCFYVVVAIFGAAIFVGLFFMKTYRWGNCP